MWTKAAVTVTGIDAPSVARASNTLLPRVRAKVTMRIAPGQDPQEAFEALKAFLEEDPPFGAHVTVHPQGARARRSPAPSTGPSTRPPGWALTEAWDGAQVVHQGIGGSIPFIADFVRTFPDATVLVTGVEDPHTLAHGYDESLHLGVFARACLGEVLLLSRLAGTV